MALRGVVIYSRIPPSISHLGEEDMEILIELTELTEEQLDLVAGGTGSASFSFTATASGTSVVSGTLTIATTQTSAHLSGSFSSSSS